MTKWEFACYITSSFSSFGGSNPNDVWNKKDKKTGLTQWDEIGNYGLKGWELVSVTPISSTAIGIRGGLTTQLLYTFKRPKPD